MYEFKHTQAKKGANPYKSANKTGIPTPLKERYEVLSGFSFDDVKVHYNSSSPAQMYAHAYTRGNHIYIAPGQEKHLGHELGHVIQQKQGLVRPDTYLYGLPLNTDRHLEAQADTYSRSAVGLPSPDESALKSAPCPTPLIQRAPFSMAELMKILDSPPSLAGILGLAAALGVSLYAAIKLYTQCCRRPQNAADTKEANTEEANTKEPNTEEATPPSGNVQKPEDTMSSDQTSSSPPSRRVGDCLFNAVADALNQPVNADYYRKLTGNYIRGLNNRNPALFLDRGINIKELLTTVETSQEWNTDSGDRIIEFLALALGIHIVVHTESYNTDINPDCQTTIHLRLEGNHYTVYQSSDASSAQKREPDTKTTETAVPGESVPSTEALNPSAEAQGLSTEAQLRSAALSELTQFIADLPEDVKKPLQNKLKKMLKGTPSYQELTDYLAMLQLKYKRQKPKTRPSALPDSPEQNTASPQSCDDTPDPVAAVLTPTGHSPSSYDGSVCHRNGIVRSFLEDQGLISPGQRLSLGHQGGKVSQSGHKKGKNKPDSDNTGKSFVVIIDSVCYEIFRANHSGQGNQQYTIISGSSAIPRLDGETIIFEKPYIKIKGSKQGYL